ncbi:glycosyltransferase involved in cell wall biosynthesis [Flavobacterium sp. CG_9.1]|uniref:glycosyltransferase family protein n=1 Tax=Flavobacterium sp. CG_9.1 TaxID=2787728 RepID=UPI0018CB41A6|nr:glycosyltransferase family 1 protein [Flavobacterium sp. CG_9.1]MBG6061089.1 glycosyltransferase involved in cell wall biosynthesis [Flavobacterium sp. CG_9.1]
MKILLIGEYSRLHNSLKEGLIALGHDVILLSSGDYFKKFDTDYSFHSSFTSGHWLPRKIKNIIHKLTGIDLSKAERGLRFYLLLPKLKNFDHVQLINSDAIETFPFLSRLLYKKLFKKIKNRSLLICGDETPVIDYLLKKETDYCILTPYFENNSLKNHFEYPLKYAAKNYRRTFDWLSENCRNLITSDLDYKIPMDKMNYKTHFIPNPVNSNKIKFQDQEINEKIVIFLGINRSSYIKKGIPYFEKALRIIQEKYPEKVTVIITENIPYSDYINKYNTAQIVLDQIYAIDQGYNALEAMAKGKVVFTGGGNDFIDHYNLKERVNIHSTPNIDSLVNEISFLIENPEAIVVIGNRARAFIEREHDHINIASQYLAAWK